MNTLDQVKDALIDQIQRFQGHPIELIEKLLIILYTAGYIDGQTYMKERCE